MMSNKITMQEHIPPMQKYSLSLLIKLVMLFISKRNKREQKPMSYERVIPRDLFNEANLLKCLGKVFINLENKPFGKIDVQMGNDGEAFDIQQNPEDGSTFCSNVVLLKNGHDIPMFRPLNSRQEWSLMCHDNDGDEIFIFDDFGNFSEEFVEFLKS